MRMRANPADDGEQRRRQPLALMATLDPSLDAIYRYWRTCSGDGLLPRRARVDVERLVPSPGYVDLLHVSGGGGHPCDYRFRVHGTLIWLDRLPIVSDTYATAAWLGAPLYEDVAERRVRRSPGYGRLVLPLTEDGRRVSVLAVCISARAALALRA